jgi:dipeptidyl aminopeptidase/acylaminoacyl peptidase
MQCVCPCFSRKTWLAAAAAGALAAGWLGYTRLGPTQTPPPAALPALAAVVAESEYTLHDAKVLHGDAKASGKGAPGDVGMVDALDIGKAYERAEKLFAQTKGKVFRATVTPHWFDNNRCFWYRNDGRGGTKEFVLVNAEAGKRRPAFDHRRLAAALSGAAGIACAADRLPFDSIEFAGGGKVVRFRAAGATWQCDLTSYRCQRHKEDMPEEPPGESPDAAGAGVSDGYPEDAVNDDAPAEEAPQQKGQGTFKGGRGGRPQARRKAASPDGKWVAFIRDNNIYLHDMDDHETRLTTVGTADNPFVSLAWAPNSKSLVMFRTEPGDRKEVFMIETSPKDQLPAKLHKRPYPRPGDKFDLHEIYVTDVETWKPVKAAVERIDYGGVPRLRWRRDGKTFTFEKIDRGHQRFRVVEVEARTGKTRNIIDEMAKTFIWTAHPPKADEIPGIWVYYLDATDEILCASERDGWKHLYLIDARTGSIKNQVTRGEWAVRGVDRVDAKARQIWFRGNGKNPGQDPYFVHYYRVNFDGTGLVALTEGNGDHYRRGGLAFSPDKKYFLDTYSRVDLPPVHELRRVADGTLVCKVDQADVSALEATGWRAPEVFVAKGRDGTTDIWGIVCRPQHFDPKKKYPVIEYIYAGPHGAFTPKTFAPYRRMAALAELGFVVVQCDGMGTAYRSRAFHDVCWKNIADAGFPDRIRWIKALARKYPYVDVTRVGIYGTSAGGQSSTGALLFHPEFYKVAVSSCGCHDNRLDKSSWNEQWMGLIGPHYEKQSNVTNAHKLQGKLLLIVGELDTNVPFESTMRVVNALIKSKKDFDLIVVPGMGHSDGGAYGERRRRDFFVRHLHGIEPPQRNAAKGEPRPGREG